MDVTLGLLGNSPASDDGGGGGGGVPSGGSTTARSILTVSNDDSKNAMVRSVEVTSSYPVVDENSDDLELGLGLSIRGGSGGGLKSKAVVAGPCWSQYARILTAKDFPSSMASKPNSSSSSSSVNIPNSSTSGTKRSAADSVSPPNGTSVVGWPPVSKAHRMPSLANQTKSQTEEAIEENKSKNKTKGSHDYCSERSFKKYRSVKVYIDGSLIGRKVDLNAHTSYENLAQALEEMFWGRRSISEAGASSRLLDGTSEFVLTYEDKDGDCMLVGDVPWQYIFSTLILENLDVSIVGQEA